MEKPVLVHVITQKGRGYSYAETHPDQYHGVAPFLVESGEARASGGISMGRIAAKELSALAVRIREVKLKDNSVYI